MMIKKAECVNWGCTGNCGKTHNVELMCDDCGDVFTPAAVQAMAFCPKCEHQVSFLGRYGVGV